jgi:glyoxylase-like metal-dependent hydrolase (beta-lactamase superfamily II)
MRTKFLIICVAVAALGAWATTLPQSSGPSTSTFKISSLERPFRLGAENATPPQKPDVALAIVKTAGVAVPKALAYSDGSWRQQAKVAFSGFLIRHGDRLFAFDLGLGSQIDAQYAADMPYWARTSFRYERPVRPLKSQLSPELLPKIDTVILSHSHWDHASGLEDFPQADIWVSPKEFMRLKTLSRGAGGPWPSQVGRADIKWNILKLTDGPYKGFQHSLDFFGDGTVVAVPLAGHTPGSLALFVTVTSGKQYMLIGDAVWNAEAIKARSSKFIGASLFVDGDRPKTAAEIVKLAELSDAEPGLVMIPAHDGDLQEALGFYPKWLK